MSKAPAIQPWMIFLGFAVLAVILNAAYPVKFTIAWLVFPGWAFVAIGAALAVVSMATFKKAFAAKGVWDPDRLMTSGLLRFSRNPFYLGVCLAFLGVGLARGNLWIIITAALMLFLLDRLVVPHEEAMLEKKFGAKYRDYKKRVRRWI